MNRKGFTLIELLAVIIILGILMIIAIPSVTNYISNSRKEAYIDTAKEIVSGTRNVVNEGKLGMYDTSATYYIPADYINTENGLKSPYGKFTQAYVGVTYDGTGYKYYWISVDDAGQGIEDVTALDDLDSDKIKSDIKDDDILDKVKTTGVSGKNNIYVLTDGSWDGPYQAERAPEGSSGGTSNIVYPTGKTKETVVTGDIVKIGAEEFYVVKHDGNDLILLAHYNLNVGNNKKPGSTEGHQDPDVRGWIPDGTKYGNTNFSSINYWNLKVGSDYPGSYCSRNTYIEGTVCAYVYYDKNKISDSNNNLYQYVNSYKLFLEEQGAVIKDARLLRVEEAFELGCGNGAWSCTGAPSFVYETAYWLGSAYGDRDHFQIWYINVASSFNYTYCDSSSNIGVRPIIVI